MKINLFLRLLCLSAIMCMSSMVQAQKSKSLKRTTSKKAMTRADQNAVAALFKDVDPKKYKLQFNDKRSTYGNLRVRMRDVQRLKRRVNPVEAAGWIVFVVEGDDVIYVLAVGNSKVESLLGKEKTKKLNSIMAKYK